VLLSPVMPDRPFEAVFMDNLREVARVDPDRGHRGGDGGTVGREPAVRALVQQAGHPRAGASTSSATSRAPSTWQRRATASSDRGRYPDRLAEIAVPTAVLVGERELAGFRAYAEEAAAGIPGARLEVLADCGHLLPFEAPDRVAAAIIDVVQRSNVRTSG
jgi:pimeloyl-ACP methyl ester carboxylesterase